MALVTIIAVNQGVTALPLTQLMAPNGVIPASTSVTLTDYNFVEQILRDDELQGYIQTDDVLLTVNSVALTKEQSLAFLDAPTRPVKNSLGESSQGPSGTDDDAAGYSIGSIWVTTAGVAYLCVVATTGNAVWTQLGGAASDPYSDIAEASTETTTTATTPVLMSGMAITPPAGTYLVWFNAEVSGNRNNTRAAVSIFSGGTQAPHSQRTHLFQASAASASLTTQTRVTVNGAQAIEGRWWIVEGVNPTLTAVDRSLMILAVETP